VVLVVNDIYEEKGFASYLQSLERDKLKLNLPFDFPKGVNTEKDCEKYFFSLPIGSNNKLNILSEREKINPSLVFLTLLKILLCRYSGENEIIIGTNFSAINFTSLESQITEYDNKVVITRTLFNNDMTLFDAIREVRKVKDEVNYLEQPIGNDKERDLLVNVMYNMYYSFDEEIKNQHILKKVDLAFNFYNIEDELKCSISYKTHLFKKQTIKRMEGHFTTLLECALSKPEIPISHMQILTSEEKNELLIEMNRPRVNYPRNSTIHELFEEQVRLNPDNVAIIFGDETVTYLELDQRANQIANYLLELGVGHENLVAIFLDRSPDMIASFLGVLKAGAAYIPFDLTYPRDRIEYMLKDSCATFIITSDKLSNQLPFTDGNIIKIDKLNDQIFKQPNNILQQSNAESLAYVMYTSGSTGKPKGVEVLNRGIVRLVKNNINYANLGPDQVILNRASVAFDVSAFEIYGSLLNGGRLVLMNSHKPTFEEIAKNIKQHGVTILRVGPDLLNVLLEDYCTYLKGVQQVFCGGEILPVWLANKFLSKLPDSQLINSYGPTENAVNATCYPVNNISPNMSSIPIGRPISNDRIYILDKYLKPVPMGVIGELCIAGDGVARGYLNRKDLTKEKFPEAHFEVTTESKLYRTGDLVRYLSDGNIEFIGRVDDQVKIRGVRIELGEVETVVGMFKGVRQSVAGTVIGKSGMNELVSYIVMDKGHRLDKQEIRSYVREKLPEHMIPTFFVELTEIPTTPVGKIDRKRLPIPDIVANDGNIVSPRNEIEEKLVVIWEKLLNVHPIGVTDHYSELGGNSLLAMRMFSEIKRMFNKSLPVSIIFQKDTIEDLAKLISNKTETDESTSLVAIQPNGTKLPIYCIHGGGGEVLIYGDLAKEIGNDQPLYGLRYTKISDEDQQLVEVLAEKYIKEIREKQPTGPYSLLGFCLGGAIAYEMAYQLQNNGHEVSLLTILNFKNPRKQSIQLEQKTIPYKDLIMNNMKQLLNKPLNQQFSFFIQKTKNALNLYRNPNDFYSQDTRHIIKRAVSMYSPKPYPGEVLLIRADSKKNLDNLGWETTDKGKIHVRCVPTDHELLLKDPHIKLVVQILNENINNYNKESYLEV
jgi:amino acid adenylation domain-containing protein